MSQEEGKLLCRCQDPNGSEKNQRRRCLDLTPVVLFAGDGQSKPEIFVLNIGLQTMVVSVLSEPSDLNSGSTRKSQRS